MEIRQRIGFSSADAVRSDSVLNLPSYSPVTHGMCQLDLIHSNGRIISADPVLGSMHRGAEKLFESRDYRQVLGLANRHEWLSAFSGEVGIAQLIERELGIDVPIHARWLRTLILEVSRITSHAAFLAGFPWLEEELTLNIRLMRERFVNHIRLFTGSRMHPMLTQIGGITHAPTAKWLMELDGLVRDSIVVTESFEEGIASKLRQYQSVGVLSQPAVVDCAVSGPAARASGLAIDQRNLATDLLYPKLQTFRSTTRSSGDISARLLQLLDEVKIACEVVSECVGECLSHIGYEVNVLIPKVLRVPEGEYEHSIETPLGIASWFLVSRGDKYPYRLKLRPASLHTVLALPEVLRGQSIDMLEPIVASMPFIAGDVDR